MSRTLVSVCALAVVSLIVLSALPAQEASGYRFKIDIAGLTAGIAGQRPAVGVAVERVTETRWSREAALTAVWDAASDDPFFQIGATGLARYRPLGQGGRSALTAAAGATFAFLRMEGAETIYAFGMGPTAQVAYRYHPRGGAFFFEPSATGAALLGPRLYRNGDDERIQWGVGIGGYLSLSVGWQLH